MLPVRNSAELMLRPLLLQQGVVAVALWGCRVLPAASACQSWQSNHLSSWFNFQRGLQSHLACCVALLPQQQRGVMVVRALLRSAPLWRHLLLAPLQAAVAEAAAAEAARHGAHFFGGAINQICCTHLALQLAVSL